MKRARTVVSAYNVTEYMDKVLNAFIKPDQLIEIESNKT